MLNDTIVMGSVSQMRIRTLYQAVSNNGTAQFPGLL